MPKRVADGAVGSIGGRPGTGAGTAPTMTRPMTKPQAVRRAALVGAGAAIASAALARRRTVAGAALACASGAAVASAFYPRTSLMGRAIARGPADRPAAALTFDDGPGPSTRDVLDALAREGARATFFVLGRQAERHPDIVRRMVREGHEVANHGYDHGILIFRTPTHVRRQLQRTERAVEAAAGPGAMSRLFRAPHGARGPGLALAAHRAGYRVAGWTRGVFDTTEPGAAAIARRGTRVLRNGAILLLHDADGWAPERPRQQTADALPEICRSARERGMALVTMTELLRA